jgi:hypothetical protein
MKYVGWPASWRRLEDIPLRMRGGYEYCDICRDITDLADFHDGPYGQRICDQCYYELCTTCRVCTTQIEVKDGVVLADESILCQRCHNTVNWLLEGLQRPTLPTA